MEIYENARNITFIKRHHFLKVYPKCTHTKNNPPCESQDGWFLHEGSIEAYKRNVFPSYCLTKSKEI